MDLKGTVIKLESKSINTYVEMASSFPLLVLSLALTRSRQDATKITPDVPPP